MCADPINIDMTIKNYRCFSDENPGRISMKNGFTALVGVNNSGKSSLLKLHYELRDIFARMNRSSDDLVNAIRSQIVFNRPNNIRDLDELFCNSNSRDLILEIKAIDESVSVKPGESLPESIVLTIPRSTNSCRAQIIHDGKPTLWNRDDELRRVADTHIKIGGMSFDMEAYYRAFEALSKTLYIGPFRNAINIGGTAPYYDMSVGEQFIREWDNLKSGGNKKQERAALRLTQDIKDLFGFKDLEINATSNNQTLQIIFDNKSYGLEELGAGLAQFIIILANIAAKQPSWVLIDEPELNLHPSLQISFLTTLASYASEGIIFATHNIGLARASADRIYSFRINESGQGEIRDFEATPNLSEFLGELSYAGYKDLGFNKVLLVEGPKDIRTTHQFLRKYHKDHKILLLPLGGCSLINAESEAELEEIKRISTDIYALIDSEREAENSPLPPERQAFLDTCQRVGINCHILERRAIENYLSDRAVKEIKGPKYSSLEYYEKLENAPLSWGKHENWRIAREMSIEELNQTDLGTFLDSL